MVKVKILKNARYNFGGQVIGKVYEAKNLGDSFKVKINHPHGINSAGDGYHYNAGEEWYYLPNEVEVIEDDTSKSSTSVKIISNAEWVFRDTTVGKVYPAQKNLNSAEKYEISFTDDAGDEVICFAGDENIKIIDNAKRVRKERVAPPKLKQTKVYYFYKDGSIYTAKHVTGVIIDVRSNVTTVFNKVNNNGKEIKQEVKTSFNDLTFITVETPDKNTTYGFVKGVLYTRTEYFSLVKASQVYQH